MAESDAERAKRLKRDRAVARKEDEEIGRQRREKTKQTGREALTGPRVVGQIVKGVAKELGKKLKGK
jgi:hypothetical protein